MAQGSTPAGRRTPADWKQIFLDTLSCTSNIKAAARAAKVDTGTVYRQRRADPVFAKAWFQALCDGYEILELELLRRLRMGEYESAKTKGKRKYDNANSLRLLIAHKETVSKMRANEQQLDEEEIIASINAKLDLMRERMREASEAEEAIALPAPAADDEQ